MKKYLLLATTAMLFAGNAMAGSIAEDGQSAIVNVKVNLVNSDTIASVQDMDFGTLAISGELATGGLATISASGVVTSNSEHIIASSATPTTAGAVTFTNALHNVDIGCETEAGDDNLLEGSICHLDEGSGLALQNFTSSTNGKTLSFGATLITENPEWLEEHTTYNVAALRVTIKY